MHGKGTWDSERTGAHQSASHCSHALLVEPRLDLAATSRQQRIRRRVSYTRTPQRDGTPLFTRPRSSDVSSSTSQRTAVTVDVASVRKDRQQVQNQTPARPSRPGTSPHHRSKQVAEYLNCERERERERERGAHFVSTVHHRYDVISICTRHVILAGARAPSGSAKQHGVVATHHRRNLVDIVFTFNSVIDINELSLRHHRTDLAETKPSGVVGCGWRA